MKEFRELAAANAVLEKLGKVKAAIQREIEGPLAGAIQDCVEAEMAIEAAEVTAVVEAEPHAGEIDKGRKRLASGRAAIDKSAERLRGLRNAGPEFVPQIIAAADGLAVALPGYYREVAEAFKPRWEAAVQQFSSILTERRQIEQAMGNRLPLEDPAPASGAEPDREIFRPGIALRELKKAVKGAAELHSTPVSKEIDPHQVFVLRKPCDRLPAGALAVSCSLPAGRLEFLAAIDGWVRRWVSPSVKAGRELARQAELDTDEARRQRIAEANAANEKALAAKRKAYQEKYYPEVERATPEQRESNWARTFRSDDPLPGSAPENT